MSRASEILLIYEDNNEHHFHEVDREWIILAMKRYAKECVESSLIQAKLSAEKLMQSDDVGEIFIDDFLKIKESIVDKDNVMLT